MNPQPGRMTRPLIAGMLLALLALFLFAWLSLAVLEGDTARLDDSIRAFIHQHASPALTILMRGFSAIGAPWLLWPMVFLTLFLLWRAGRRYEALVIGVSMSGAALLETALKVAFHRERPAPYFGLAEPTSYSYPSGHALFAFCFYGTLAVLSASRVRKPAHRAATWMAAASMIFLIGLSRIYLGVHYPSDVIAGYAAALIWMIAVTIGFHLRRGTT